MRKRVIGASMQQQERSQASVCLPIVRLQAHRFAVVSERFFPVALTSSARPSGCFAHSTPNGFRLRTSAAAPESNFETGYRLIVLTKKKKPRCVLTTPGLFS
jgi:hypothetical protein